MIRLTPLLFSAPALLLLFWIPTQEQNAWSVDDFDIADRVERARALRGAIMRDRFSNAGLPYPPREIFLRVFKHEAELELWARDDAARFQHIATWKILANSGQAGPKRREGDRQVPEGFYKIERFNPRSLYHLSLGLDYPNASDRVRSDPQRPGSDIFIHGGDRTIGCLPLGDDAIEELYLIALDTHVHQRNEIAVHIFPARMSSPSWNDFVRINARGELNAFWEELRPGFEEFERERYVPRIEVDSSGRYRVLPR